MSCKTVDLTLRFVHLHKLSESVSEMYKMMLTKIYETKCMFPFLDSIPDGLAVDAISRLIFYTDTGNDIIAVVTLDGSASAVIINSDLDEPRAIVVSPNQA